MVTLGRNGIPCGREFLQHRSKVLQQRVQHLLPLWQQKMGLAVRRVTLKDMSSRWGSCTARLGHISLSQRLGAMPDSLIELVLVHELCHMFHQDHSPAFHAEMARWLPDHRTREQQLKAMSRQLHYPPEEEVP